MAELFILKNKLEMCENSHFITLFNTLIFGCCLISSKLLSFVLCSPKLTDLRSIFFKKRAECNHANLRVGHNEKMFFPQQNF